MKFFNFQVKNVAFCTFESYTNGHSTRVGQVKLSIFDLTKNNDLTFTMKCSQIYVVIKYVNSESLDLYQPIEAIEEAIMHDFYMRSLESLFLNQLLSL